MKYQILIQDDAVELENLVTAALANGWKLQGGLAVIGGKDADGCNVFSFAQAVTHD